MKVKEYADRLYFTSGYFTDHSVGYFLKSARELVVVDDGYLPKIMKYFRGANNDVKSSITLSWYRKESPAEKAKKE